MCRICTLIHAAREGQAKGEFVSPQLHDPTRFHTDTEITEARRLEALAELRGN